MIAAPNQASADGGPFKDYAAFLNALRSGKLDDRLDYAR